MNVTLDAILRRLMTFVGAAFGTFVIYLLLGELTGATAGTPLEGALSLYVAKLLTKTTAILTGGHAIALGILARARRGFVAPPLRRSAMAGVACATALDMAYVSGTWVSEISIRGIFRVALATVISLAFLALRVGRPDPEPRSASPGAAAAVEPDFA